MQEIVSMKSTILSTVRRVNWSSRNSAVYFLLIHSLHRSCTLPAPL